MNAPKIGLITFGDHRGPEWERVFKGLTVPRHELAVKTLASLPIKLISSETVARTREEINAQVDALKGAGVEMLVAHTPCWTSPNLVVHGVQRMGLYTVVLGNREMGTHGCVGLLGAAGALAQCGVPHRRVRLDYDEAAYTRRLLPLMRAGAAVARLRGSVFGHFGGRSIGIDTATFDPMGWKKQFGVDTEHIDQVEIIRLAGMIAPERIAKMRSWIEQNAKEVRYDDSLFTKEKFDFQLACYLATKDLRVQHGLDFTAVKCMPELSNHYVPQCMTATFLPSDYDGEEGWKDATVMACEADADGALTAQILKLVSGGMPTFFADVSHIDDVEKTIYCVNCGAICAWYAGRSQVAEENLKRITFKQSIRPGGAAISAFFAAEGPMQLARLYRVDGKYHMAIIPARAVTPDQAAMDRFVAARGQHQLPALFAKVDIDVDILVERFGSNHISGVAGNYVNELVEACKLLGVKPELFDAVADREGHHHVTE